LEKVNKKKGENVRKLAKVSNQNRVAAAATRDFWEKKHIMEIIFKNYQKINTQNRVAAAATRDFEKTPVAK